MRRGLTFSRGDYIVEPGKSGATGIVRLTPPLDYNGDPIMRLTPAEARELASRLLSVAELLSLPDPGEGE